MKFINPLCSLCDIKMFDKCLFCFNYICYNDHHNYVCPKCCKSYLIKCDNETFKCDCDKK